jgi:hypothetical protein
VFVSFVSWQWSVLLVGWCGGVAWSSPTGTLDSTPNDLPLGHGEMQPTTSTSTGAFNAFVRTLVHFQIV